MGKIKIPLASLVDDAVKACEGGGFSGLVIISKTGEGVEVLKQRLTKSARGRYPVDVMPFCGRTEKYVIDLDSIELTDISLLAYDSIRQAS